jgi:MoaA/NifB/PqqE/SkfB family radical SAM enzyme
LRKFHIRSSKRKRGLVSHRAVGEYQGLPLHLRVEDDGSGILIVNAARMLFLNRTATEYTRLFLEGKNEEEVAKAIQKTFRVKKDTALRDYRDLLFVINTVAKTEDIDPVSYLGIDKIEPFEKELSAPYMMELAVTNRCDVQCNVHASHPMRELRTDEWTQVIDTLHSLGIPHVIFTGGEPTLRDDLDALIRYTQHTGLVSGLETHGRTLRDNAYLNRLIDAGLDHIQIAVESHDAAVHDAITGVQGSWDETLHGLKNAIATPIYTITKTTLTPSNANDILKTIDFLHDLDLNQLACTCTVASDDPSNRTTGGALDEASLRPLIDRMKDYAASRGMEFIWYTPQHHRLSSADLEDGIPETRACRVNLYVEPDGTVIPYQNYLAPLGNILTDTWATIWHHPICHRLRQTKHTEAS